MDFVLPVIGCAVAIFASIIAAIFGLWKVCKLLCPGSVLARRVYMLCLTPVVVVVVFKAQVVIGVWLIMLWAQGIDDMNMAGR